MGGGMGMAGMGGLEQQFTWLHSIQQFTSSLGYLTEVRFYASSCLRATKRRATYTL